MSDGLTIRKTTAKIGNNKNTFFAMRHKLLHAISVFRKSVKLSKKLEADKVIIPINSNGMKQEDIPRFSIFRKSASKSLNHKSCII